MNPLLRRLSVQPFRRTFRRLRDVWRGETSESFWDIHDPRTLVPMLSAYGIESPTTDSSAVVDVPSAVRFLIGLRMASRRWRAKMPRGLSEGERGRFGQWVIGGGCGSLSPTARAFVRQAFAANLSQRVHRVFELRFDLRDVFPLGLTPMGRGAYLEWLLVHGRNDLGLREEEILWWLFESDEDPSRGLAATWALQPSWQRAVPNALTPSGWQTLQQWLGSEYGLRSRWVQTASLPPQPSIDPSVGVNVLAHFRYPSGLQEAAVAIVRGLEANDIPTARRDIPVRFACDWRDLERYHAVEVCDTSIVCAAVNTFLDKFLPESGLHIRPGVRRIAVWYWELDQLPTEWVERIHQSKLIDEVWAPTRFIADAVRSSVRIPVVPMLPGVELPSFTEQPRSRFGLDESKFLFLFMFDMNSAMERKNPLGLIEAYRRAFPQREAGLVIKVSRAECDPENRAALIDACRSVGATLIDEVLPREDVLALMACCDSYVSLHRSEGFGLTMAEAMLMGKPTIATAYSGNLDFMTPETSYLVRSDRVPLVKDLFPYPKGCHWAEPSVDHAAELMRRVFEHRAEAARIGAAGQASLRELLSIQAAGERMSARLRQLRSGATATG